MNSPKFPIEIFWRILLINTSELYSENIQIIEQVGEGLVELIEAGNINSIKIVEKAINYEIERQINLLEEGKKIIQETRLYDETKGVTKSMRSKEEANDYRYFPDPDLLPIEIDENYIIDIKKMMPDLPDKKEKEYKTNYEFNNEQINILLSDIEITKFIDQVLKISKVNAKKIVNYFISSIYIKINKENLCFSQNMISAEDFCTVIESIENKIVSKSYLKKIIDDIWSNKNPVKDVIVNLSSNHEIDDEKINTLIKITIQENKKQVEEYKSGKTKIIGFFVGKILKKVDGVDPSEIKNKIIKILDSI